MKKKLLVAVSYLLILALGVMGTVAYFTDREADVNVFTVGDVEIELNEVFNQAVELMPGKKIEKEVTVTNTGKNDAWVWVTIAIPSALDNDDASQNAIHFNYAKDSVGDGKWTWMNGTAWNVEKDAAIKGDNNKYNIYTVMYQTALKPGAVTESAMTQVYMDTRVDMTPEGDLYIINNGVPENLNWNVNADKQGTPLIYVAAYAIQKDTFETVQAARDAYLGQWGGNNAKYPSLEDAVKDEWDGTADTTWYNDTDTEFKLNTVEQVAGLAELVDGGNTFEGKTIKLNKNLDLYTEDANGEPVSFEPIGSFSDNKAFKGVFDGQGHTVYNMYQNGWALANGYWDGPEYGMGFFSLVEDATIKNINFDNASLPTEANIIGVVAGGAGGNCVFENITVTDSYLGNHSWYSGGLIGWAEGNQKVINCDVDETNVVSSQWGDFNNANGGLIGGIDSDGTYYFEDCNVACVIDAYNDVTSAYEWYSYRSCGMLIGDTGTIDDPDGNNVGNATAPNVTCKNVTVTYGDWANYHYCEFGSAGYPFCRVEAGESTGAYGNARVGEYFDANGNKVVDNNHTHNDGEKHNELIVFDQLYGGQSGDRYCTYGTATHPGVTVIYNNK